MVLKHRTTKKSLRRKKMAVFISLSVAVCTMAVALALLFVDVTQIVIDFCLRITPGSAVMEFMGSEMETVYNQVFLFSIINGDRFLTGLDKKLFVKEVGPFTYKEVRKNDHLELDVDAGVMRYSINTTPVFVPERSIGHPQDFNVTMINLPMLGVSSLVSSFSYFPRVGFNLVSQQINSKPFITIDAHNYLWGYPEPILKLANRILPGVINFDRLGILQKLYDKNQKHEMEVSALNADKFRIKKRNGLLKLQLNEQHRPESCKDCDTFEDAYEGLMFPTPVTPESKINLFRTGLCKLLDMEFSHRKRMETYDVMVFRLSDKFFSINKSSVNDGLLDLSDCYYGLPISLSKLNFLAMNPEIYERIEGLNKPDPKHHTYIMVDPKLGFMLDTYVPIQINMVTKDLSYHSLARPFSNMVIPICYVIIKQLDLKQNTLKSLNTTYRTVPIALSIVKFILFATSIILLAYSIKLWRIVKNEGAKMIKIPYPVFTAHLPLLDQKKNELNEVVKK